MKNEFWAYHPMSEKDQKDIWENGIFCYDTNILLTPFRATGDLKDKLIDIIKKRKDRTIIPYQIAKEFYSNVHSTIEEQNTQFQSLISLLASIKEHTNSELGKNGSKYNRHPSIQFKNISDEINNFLNQKILDIQEQEARFKQEQREANLFEAFTDVFKDCLGPQYEDSTIKEIEQEGKDRYKNKIPPGYKDSRKGDSENLDSNNAFGDLIVWFQLIDIAKKTGKHIIFVSNDVKEDWILKVKGRKKGVRPELRKEFYDKTNKHIHIVTIDKFIEFASKQRNENILTPDESIELDFIQNLTPSPKHVKKKKDNRILTGEQMSLFKGQLIDDYVSMIYLKQLTQREDAKNSFQSKYQIYIPEKVRSIASALIFLSDSIAPYIDGAMEFLQNEELVFKFQMDDAISAIIENKNLFHKGTHKIIDELAEYID